MTEQNENLGIYVAVEEGEADSLLPEVGAIVGAEDVEVIDEGTLLGKVPSLEAMGEVLARVRKLPGVVDAQQQGSVRAIKRSEQ